MPTAAAPPLIAIGGMRLSTARDRDEARAIAVLHAAFDAGINFIDTADAYCWDASEAGHNERLIARALACWPGDRSRVRLATKGGLTRPEGRWIADGRARHLVAACEASRRALDVDRIHLYQLHAPDPRTTLATSVRALAALKRDGLIESIGLCNVTVGQIEEARRITGIAAVQAELSIWNDGSILGGVAEYCIANGIRFLAYRPLGGPKRLGRTRSERVLGTLAARHGATPFEIALAWLRDLSDLIVPIPGPTRVETVHSVARAHAIVLTDEDRAVLDERFPSGRALRLGGESSERRAFQAHQAGEASRAAVRESVQQPQSEHARGGQRPGWGRSARENAGAPRATGEVVLIMGLPGAGKSTVAASFVAEGYERLNRDDRGGSVRGLLPAVASGSSRMVLDNTYVSRKSRAAVIQAASQRGLPVRCIWLSTGVEDAQVNAAGRIVSRYGRLLGPDEMREASKQDTAAFGPAVQFRYQRELEPPDPAEGFSRIEVMTFERRRDPSCTNRALILWCDGVLRRSRSGQRTPFSAEDVEVFAERGEVLRRHEAAGWRILGLSWQPEIADGTMASVQADEALARMQELLGVSIEVAYCPHGAGPPACWCRKPLPGLGVVFIERHKLDASQCVYVGAGPQDPGFARRLGFQYRDAADFFAPGRG
jgi:aryl-alcohol dehydrogenase-like predicted oxidoreductase/histidinol phosphatase-like enzyme